MSQFRQQVTLYNKLINTTFGATFTWESAESGLATNIITGLTSTPVTVSYGSIQTPRVFQCQLLSGSDAEVSLDNGSTYPIRMSGAKDATSVRINFEALREISSVTVTADTAGSLSGKYFDVTALSGTVRIWMNPNVLKEITTVETIADVASALHEDFFVIHDAAGSVAVWFDVGGLDPGVPAGAAGYDRQVEVDFVEDATAEAVATAILTAFAADPAFVVTRSGDTLTFTDATAGVRTNATAESSGFTVTTTQSGTAVTAPSAPGGGRNLPVAYTRDATAIAVAAAIVSAVEADDELLAESDGVSLVTITDQFIGNRTNIVDGDTGWTVATVQSGGTAPVLKVRSLGTSEVMTTIFPN